VVAGSAPSRTIPHAASNRQNGCSSRLGRAESHPSPKSQDRFDAPLPRPIAGRRLHRVPACRPEPHRRDPGWDSTPGCSPENLFRKDFQPVAESQWVMIGGRDQHDGLAHLIETIAFPLVSHSRHRSQGAKSTMRSLGPSPREGRAAGWISPSCPQDAHSTITKSPGLRSLMRAE
jgi:hypothetical protein